HETEPGARIRAGRQEVSGCRSLARGDAASGPREVSHAEPSRVAPACGRRGRVLGLPARRAERAPAGDAPRLPPQNVLPAAPHRNWAELRRQWLLAPDHVNLNCGSVGCSPLPVLNAVIDHLLSAEALREPAYPWFGYEENPRLRELRDALAG